MILRRILSATVAIATFWVLTTLVNWEEAYENFLQTNLLLFTAGASLTLLWPLVGAARWKNVVNALGHTVTFYKALKAVMIAFSANIFAPAKSGDLVKVLVMKEIAGKKVLMSGVLAERMGDLFVLGLFSAIGGVILDKYLESSIGLGVMVGIIIGVFMVSRIQLRHKKGWFHKIWQVATSSSMLWFQSPSNMGKAMLWSGVNWGLAGVQVWLFFLAMGGGVSLLTVLALFPITVLITLFPVTPGGLGIRESAFVFLFMPYSEPHISIAASLGYYICNTGITGIMGFVFVHSHLSGNNSVPIDL